MAPFGIQYSCSQAYRSLTTNLKRARDTLEKKTHISMNLTLFFMGRKAKLGIIITGTVNKALDPFGSS